MSVHSKRPGPGAYDHLWSLLPVFIAFLTVIVFAAVTDERPLQAGQVIEFEALPTDSYVPAGPDASVPAAEAAMARLPDAAAAPVAAF